MLLVFLNFFLDFKCKIFIPIYFTLIFALLFPIITATPKLSSLTNEDTSPMKIQQTITDEFIKDNSDLFLISTKDGYLHAINKEKKQVWKVYLEQELMSSTISTIKLKKDFILYPINEKLYIYKDGNFISFNIFIKDLVKRHFITISDFTLLGKTKTTVFIIDADTGEILQKIDDESNFTYKKRYILSKNKNTIKVVRVDYILYCSELGEEQKCWNVSYSDIIIEKGNENVLDNFKIIQPDLKEIIKIYNMNNDDENNDISFDNVITAYSYFKKDLPTFKIYDRSNSEFEGEIKLLQNYNNENRLRYKENNNNINNNILEDLNIKSDLLKLPNYLQDNNKDNNNHLNNNNDIFNKGKYYNYNNKDKLLEKLKTNWYLYIIIIILLVQLIYYKGFYISTKKKEKEKEKESNIKKDEENTIKNENNNDNNKEIIGELNNLNENNFNIDDFQIKSNKTISFKDINNLENIHIKKYSYDQIRKSKRKSNINNIKKSDLKMENNESKSISIKSKNIINSNENSIENNENNKNEKINNPTKPTNEIKSNSNNNSQSLEDKKENSSTNKGSNGIWDEEDEEEDEDEYVIKDNNNNKKENSIKIKNKENTIKSTNGIWDEEDDEDENNDNKNEKEENNINSKNTKNINNTVKSTNGIWDDDDNEDEKEKQNINNENEKTKSKNNSKKISSNINNENDDDSYEHKSTKEKSKESKEIEKHIIKEKKLSRLDTDFENLEKIGEGGFGIVLKGTHKIDKDIYAIKIIDLTFNKKEYEEIISEAKK